MREREIESEPAPVCVDGEWSWREEENQAVINTQDVLVLVFSLI